MRIVMRGANGALLDIANPKHVGTLDEMASMALGLWQEAGLSTLAPHEVAALRALAEIKSEVAAAEAERTESAAVVSDVTTILPRVSTKDGYDDWVEFDAPNG